MDAFPGGEGEARREGVGRKEGRRCRPRARLSGRPRLAGEPRLFRSSSSSPGGRSSLLFFHRYIDLDPRPLDPKNFLPNFHCSFVLQRIKRSFLRFFFTSFLNDDEARQLLHLFFIYLFIRWTCVYEVMYKDKIDDWISLIGCFIHGCANIFYISKSNIAKLELGRRLRSNFSLPFYENTKSIEIKRLEERKESEIHPLPPSGSKLEAAHWQRLPSFWIKGWMYTLEENRTSLVGLTIPLAAARMSHDDDDDDDDKSCPWNRRRP